MSDQGKPYNLTNLFGIDWKTRFKNKTVLLSLIVAALAFIYQLLGLFSIAPPVSQDEVINVCTLGLNFLVILGVITDPNTPGMTDGDDNKEK